MTEPTLQALYPDPPLLPAEQAALRSLARRWVQAYPDLYSVAAERGEHLLRSHTRDPVDANTLYWHRFDRAVSSPRTFTGWEHYPRPVESMTLAELVIHRFNVQDQDSADTLQMMGGFYHAGPDARRFDERNELRVLPQVLLDDFWHDGFKAAYQQRLRRFWDAHHEDFRVLGKARLLAAALRERSARRLQDADFDRIVGGLLGQVAPPFSVAALQASTPAGAGLHLRVFDIAGFHARDMLRITDGSGHEVLYIATEEPPFRVFENAGQVYRWVRDSCAEHAPRQQFMAHFLGHDPDDDSQWQALNQHIDQVFYHDLDYQPPVPSLEVVWGPNGPLTPPPPPARQRLLNRDDEVIRGDGFTWLAAQARTDMEGIAEHLLVANSQLRKGLWLGYLGVVLKLGGAVAPLGWPLALGVVGAGLASVGLNIDRAVNSPREVDRKAGMLGAIFNVVDVLFNATLLTPGAAVEEAFEPWQDAFEASSWRPTLPPVADPLPLPVPAVAPGDAELAQLLEGKESNAILSGKPIAEGPHRGIFVQGGDQTFIEIDDLPYRVRFDKHLQTWLIVDPANPHGFYGARPVRLGPDGQWQVQAQVGLKGGQRWLSAFRRVHAERLAQPVQLQPAVDTVFVDRPMDGIVPVDEWHFTVALHGRYQPVHYDADVGAWFLPGKGPRSYVWRAGGGQWRQGTLAEWRGANPLPPVNVERLQLPAIPRVPSEVEEVPKVIHYLWIGNGMPKAELLDNLWDNAWRSPGWRNILHVDLDTPEQLGALKEQLMARNQVGVTNLQVHDLNRSGFFKRFLAGTSGEQYQLLRQGVARNYSSCSDVLRYPLANEFGGMYLDVDDTLAVNFAHVQLKAAHGDLLLNRAVLLEAVDFTGYNSSNFATLPNNPLLTDIERLMRERFEADPGFYLRQRPVLRVDAQGNELPHSAVEFWAYMREVFYRHGPQVLNDVLKARRPDYYDLWARHSLDQTASLYVTAYERNRLAAVAHYLPFSTKAMKVEIGSAHSWKTSR